MKLKSNWYMHLKLLIILCYSLDYAWRCWSVVEFESSDFSLALLQVCLNWPEGVNKLMLVKIALQTFTRPICCWIFPCLLSIACGVFACGDSFAVFSHLAVRHESSYWAYFLKLEIWCMCVCVCELSAYLISV